VLPRLRGPVDGDANAAVAVFSTVLLGLLARARTGLGPSAETSMIGANALAYADDVNRYRDKPPFPLPDAENYGMSALYRLYGCETGWVFLAAPGQRHFEALAAALDRHDLVDDPRFATADARAAHDDALAAVLAEVMATRAAADWEAELAPKGIAVAAASATGSSEFTCTDAGLRESGLVVEVEHPTLGRILRHGLPVAFSETPGRIAPSCMNGEHTDRILAELGYSPEEVAGLHDAGVVHAPA
jgi:crotonobetainyl-CoA:carnitine CoA-transferase CaiB-like acyl-CoA transferase